MAERHDIPVVVKGGSTTMWTLTVTKPSPHTIVLALAGDAGRRWDARSGDVFDALMNLRRKLEPVGVQLCCNGARRNAWSSGMQRDMGGGYATYLLELGEHRTRPKHVRTLDPAPPSEVVTVAEQLAFQEQWRAERSDWAR
jgi:hypothetical protein